jgi:hypothetical protein
MPNEPNPCADLARRMEDWLRAAADAVAEVRAHLESRQAGPPGRRGSGPGVRAEASPLWEWGKRYVLEPLRDAVRQESHRWEARSVGDPAAARVHEVFRTLLEILEEAPEEPSLERDPARGPSRADGRQKPPSGGSERRAPAKRTRR